MKLPAGLGQLEDTPRDGVILIDEDGTIVYAGPKLDTFLGHRKTWLDTPLPPALSDIHAVFLQSGKGFASDSFRCEHTGIETDIFVYKVDGAAGRQKATVIVIKDPSSRFTTESYLAQTLAGSIPEDPSTPSEEPGPQFQSLKGQDNSFRRTLVQAQKAAWTRLPILIIGESGTGKEGLARAIHQASDRNEKPFVDVNCAAIPDTLIESELFGYEGGAFTGARRRGQRGLFDEAHGGTIFLDEIGDASVQTQAKILRVLQEGCFKRIGGTRNVAVNVRPISATNKNLMDLISQGIFRPDLFYRLNTIIINLPPLRERREDIRLLANHFLDEHRNDRGKGFSFSSKAMRLMEAYQWPGNVRELRGVVDYAATMASTMVLSPDSFPSFMRKIDGHVLAEPAESQRDLPTGTGQGLLAHALQEVERTLISQVLARSRTRSDAIKALGISRRTFYLKIKKYGLD
jgi:transcriptional regulator with PAS, ATPase and Fis domain